MRRIRDTIQWWLPVAGTIIVLAAVLLVIQLHLQIVLVVIGLLMMQAGVWRLAQPLLPDTRKYQALRDEVDRFIDLVRRLNSVALDERRRPGRAVSAERSVLLERMHRSVDRMGELAGMSEGSEPEPAPSERRDNADLGVSSKV